MTNSKITIAKSCATMQYHKNSASYCIAIDFGQDVAKNKDKGKVVDGNGQGNAHDVNQLAGSGNTNDREEDVPKNDVVEKFIVLHPPIPVVCHRKLSQ
jgi:hypothetical protein